MDVLLNELRVSSTSSFDERRRESSTHSSPPTASQQKIHVARDANIQRSFKSDEDSADSGGPISELVGVGGGDYSSGESDVEAEEKVGGVFDLDLGGKGSQQGKGRKVVRERGDEARKRGEGRSGRGRGGGQSETHLGEVQRFQVSDQQSFRSEGDPESDVVEVSKPKGRVRQFKKGKGESISSSHSSIIASRLVSSKQPTHWYQVGCTQVAGQLNVHHPLLPPAERIPVPNKPAVVSRTAPSPKKP